LLRNSHLDEPFGAAFLHEFHELLELVLAFKEGAGIGAGN
jgi:hypothetical protein